jgi:hypothetical protein
VGPSFPRMSVLDQSLTWLTKLAPSGWLSSDPNCGADDRRVPPRTKMRYDNASTSGGGETMRTLLAITLLALSGFANAAAEEACNLGSLRGRFVFTGRGFIEAVQPGVQRVHYGIFVF